MKKKFCYAALLLGTLALTSCFNQKSSANSSNADNPGGDSSDVQPEEKKGWEDPKTYTYNDYLTVCPSNWNQLTYQDNNDTEIMGFIGSNFFRFNYKFNADGSIVPGDFTIESDCIQDVFDITEQYAGQEGLKIPAGADSDYAFKFVLRDNLKWDDGTPIKAEDFVYTMKEQENPLFQNYRADSYYNGATVIHNAQNYVKQGQSGWFASKECYGGDYNESQDSSLIFHMVLPLAENDPYGGKKPYILTGTSLAKYLSYVEARGAAWTMNALWGCPSTEEEFAAMEGKTLAQIKADATLKGYWEKLIGWWQTDPGEELDFFVTYFTYGEMSFDQVGLKVGEKENELIIILDKALPLFKEDGSLSYHAAYEFGDLPLVKKDLYERCKIAPTTEGGLWTTNYNTDLDKTASWGPYKLAEFQAGKGYKLVRNENWYGYGLPQYAGQYQTDIIDVEVIANYETAFLKFKEGDIAQIGIDVSVADEYKNSSRAFFTASDFVGSLQLQSNTEKLAERSDAENNINKRILGYVDFRKAISLAIDRDDYNNKCTTSSLAGFGLFNSMHYYDVENGGVYRNTDQAKRVICEVYGVNVDAYNSLDEAYAAVTGYNLTLARELLNKAYDEALAAGDIDADDVVLLTVGTAEETISTRRVFEYLKATFENLAVGTKLEGRLTLEFDTHWGTQWADDFRAGSYDICTGGWTGAAWNPGYFLLAYLSPDYMYSQAWDTEAAMLEFNPYADGDDEHKYNMSLMDWYKCLNGAAEPNFGAGQVDEEIRLNIIAALEKEILKVYYTVPISYSFSAGMISYKMEFITREYNTFMGYGGIRYITYNYDDVEWDKVKGSFDYTK